VDLEYGSRVLCTCARNQAVDALTEKLTHFEPLVSSSFFVCSIFKLSCSQLVGLYSIERIDSLTAAHTLHSDWYNCNLLQMLLRSALTALVVCSVCAALMQVFGSATGLGATASQYTLDARIEADDFLQAWRATRDNWQSALQTHTTRDMLDWLDYLWQSENKQLEVPLHVTDSVDLLKAIRYIVAHAYYCVDACTLHQELAGTKDATQLRVREEPWFIRMQVIAQQFALILLIAPHCCKHQPLEHSNTIAWSGSV
jgi:hypothetical protein